MTNGANRHGSGTKTNRSKIAFAVTSIASTASTASIASIASIALYLGLLGTNLLGTPWDQLVGVSLGPSCQGLFGTKLLGSPWDQVVVVGVSRAVSKRESQYPPDLPSRQAREKSLGVHLKRAIPPFQTAPTPKKFNC